MLDNELNEIKDRINNFSGSFEELKLELIKIWEEISEIQNEI